MDMYGILNITILLYYMCEWSNERIYTEKISGSELWDGRCIRLTCLNNGTWFIVGFFFPVPQQNKISELESFHSLNAPSLKIEILTQIV